MKQRNPRFGCRRIAQQLSYAFRIDLDKDVVRRVLACHYRPESGGPSWLTFLGHTKDSLWSVDLLRCESLLVKTHWVMVVMDHCTRRIVGFAVQAGVLDGPSVCRMLNRIVSDAQPLPHSLSSDHDPLFEFHRWKANLRILEIEEVKTVPYVPLSHPFIERLIGTLRREFLDYVPFWTARDLEQKLLLFKEYYNRKDSYLIGWSDPNRKGRKSRPPAARSRAVSMGSALPRAISTASGGLNRNSPQTRRGASCQVPSWEALVRGEPGEKVRPSTNVR